MTQLKTIDDCVPYSGWPHRSWPYRSLYDAKNLAMHAVIARKLSRDPALPDKARKNLRRTQEKYDPDALPPFIEQWEALLARPPQELAACLVSVTDDAVRLRHRSPFTGILTAPERLTVLDAFDREIRRVAGDVIDINPDIMIGAPVFRGTRVPVQSLPDQLAGGYDLGYFLEHFPTVSREQATRLLHLSAETLAAEAGYEPLKNRQPAARPDNAVCRIINIDTDIVSGTPVFTGTRVPVRILTDNLVAGDGLDEFLDNYPSVSREQAVLFIRLAEKMTDYASGLSPIT